MGRIILDTSALYFPRAIRKLPGNRRVLVPTVVLVERARHLKSERRGSPSEFLLDIRNQGWETEPLGDAEALLAAHRAPMDDKEWADRARDTLIAGHVRDGDVLWTADVADFLALGLPPTSLRDVSKM